MADRVGQQFGNYRLVALLGQGGYAEVYLGQHLRLKQHAAIKVLHAHLTGTEAEHFQQEAQTISTLVHASIIRVFDYDVQEGMPFLVMDYAPNGSLRTRYPKGSLVSLPQIISFVKQVTEALQYAHDQKFIHRDVKPENMLLGRREEVLLSDFGIAAVAHSSGSLSTQEAVGTLSYMAPEQIEGRPRVASDQYALGCVVYEWLCGSRPFEGSPTEVLVQQLSIPPAPLREKVATIAPGVEQVVLRALAKDPKERFASVQDFATALEEANRETSYGQTQRALSSAYVIGYRSPQRILPAQLTPLIGREQEVAAGCALLRHPEVRLVTLTGSGGIGKTRLALQLSTELIDDFTDGVCFVSLAAISDPDLVVPTIAQTLDVKESGARPMQELLQAFLKEKQMLLVLDNFEQVVTAAPRLSDLLAACPHLELLVTSRQVLRLSAEHEFAVPPLSLPDLKHLPDPLMLSQYEAVALFIARAQAARPAFQLTNATASAVAQICARLDGLPLAIELAAARIKLLPPQALLTRLSSRLTVLTGGSQDVPIRQQTLRGTIAWSYHLLDAAEQWLFRGLAVFSGGFTLEAAEAVCITETNNPAGQVGSVLDGVASLIDKSLLQQTEQEGEEARLVMLETIREYAWEALVTNGEAEETQRAHAAYYLALAEETEPRLVGAEKGRWLAQLQLEHENLRAAIAWLVEHQEQEAALRLCGALWRFWWMRGSLSEGRAEITRALAGSREMVAMRVRAKALLSAGALAVVQGDFEQVSALCEESLSLFRTLGDRQGSAASLTRLGQVAMLLGGYSEARSLLEEAVTLYREADDKNDITLTQVVLSSVFLFLGEYERARALAEEAAELVRAGGDSWDIANFNWNLAMVMFFLADLTRAQVLLDEGLAYARREGYKEALANSLYVSGLVAMQQGDNATARARLQESLALSRDLGDGQLVANSLSGLAWDSLTQGDYTAARALFEESLALYLAMGNQWFIAFCLVGFAALAAAQEAWVWTARLLGAAEALCEAIHGALLPSISALQESTSAAARAQLGEEVFTAAWAEGRTMTPEQALDAQGAVTMSTTAPAEPSSIPHTAQAPTYPAGLTAREVEVLRLVAQGLSDAQVAAQLVISPRTVNSHLTSIYNKLGVDSRTAASRFAVEHQLA
jgi:predicted ATPase/DNA-binding CsgD family transcriptional regulator/tRNA A-37 threonylcarbamoyl transferase component Bud32/Tfp pilus assembly protein PilF